VRGVDAPPLAQQQQQQQQRGAGFLHMLLHSPLQGYSGVSFAAQQGRMSPADAVIGYAYGAAGGRPVVSARCAALRCAACVVFVAATAAAPSRAKPNAPHDVPSHTHIAPGVCPPPG
jgi:hypothetical protein